MHIVHWLFAFVVWLGLYSYYMCQPGTSRLPRQPFCIQLSLLASCMGMQAAAGHAACRPAYTTLHKLPETRNQKHSTLL
jgi:hypothetical protein